MGFLGMGEERYKMIKPGLSYSDKIKKMAKILFLISGNVSNGTVVQ